MGSGRVPAFLQTPTGQSRPVALFMLDEDPSEGHPGLLPVWLSEGVHIATYLPGSDLASA